MKPGIQFSEAVTRSVERMERFCYLAQMTLECAEHHQPNAQVNIPSRVETMTIVTASFLYSLFDDSKKSMNLSKIWQGFNHPFEKELQEFTKKLAPFKSELKKVRHRVGFHGSLSRSRESEGLDIFNISSQRAHEFFKIIWDMRDLACKMIRWYLAQEEPENPLAYCKYVEFCHELAGHLPTHPVDYGQKR